MVFNKDMIKSFQIHIYFETLHTQYELTPPMAGVKATLSALPPAGLGETETVL